MNTFQLECFLSVAAHLNFAQAAEKLNITQPAVSHQIRSLEAELDVKLLNRSTRGVSLTHEGEVFLPEAQSLFIMFKGLQNKFAAPQKRGMIPLRISCTSEMLSGLLPDVLYRLAVSFPDIHPILRNIPTPLIAKKISEGETDIALGLKESLPDNGVVYTELTRTPLVCVCDNTHPLGDNESISLGMLKDHCLILYKPSFCDSEIAALQTELTKGRQSNELFFCDDITSALTLARAGYGVTVLPHIFLPAVLPDIRVIPVSDAAPLSFGIYHKKNRTEPQKLFADLLKERLADKPSK